ncbi:MAG: phosphate acyltransferase PlsX [Bdellovibrionota bacterium]
MSASVKPAAPKLILDVMGGDHAPLPNLEGAAQALPFLRKEAGELILVGDESIIRPWLSKRRKLQPLARALEDQREENLFRVRLVHAPQTIDMEDSIRAIRNKPGASINVGCEMAAEGYLAGRPAAFISAGHSGAVMASALLRMGRLPGIERPAIAVKLPTLSADGCVLLDVGANVDCKPEHLRDFALMGALFAQADRRSKELPRVGILSNGEERKKGNELTRATLTLVDQIEIFRAGPGQIARFVGYAEGKEIFKGEVEVVVTDGFVGNVVLKSIEGLGSAITTILKNEAMSNPLNMLGFGLAAGVFRRFKRRLDYAEYGAAPLLGVAGYAFICHGRSNPRAIKNALLRARTALKSRFVERLQSALEVRDTGRRAGPALQQS